MTLKHAFEEMLPAIENEMKAVISHSMVSNTTLQEMLTYHLGWSGIGAGAEASGKRIRPMITSLSCEAAGGDWRIALPAAACVELIHNFSLIHDDIEDRSDRRRGRETVWVKWGEPQAINAGDLLYTLAFASLDRLRNRISDRDVLEAQQTMHQTCIALTKGQFLDMAFERAEQASLEDYWGMIEGKTAALLEASTRLGAICAGVEESVQAVFQDFGRDLGLAFQVWDDWLGIWGDEGITGKSAANDLVSGKKTYPILFGLQQDGAFRQFWQQNSITGNNIRQAISLLEESGAKEATYKMAAELSHRALGHLEKLDSSQPGYLNLVELTHLLLNRQR